LLEIEKCKNDIVYFIETYCYPKIVLSDFDKEIIKAHQEGRRIMLLGGRGYSRYFIATSAKRHEEFKKTHS
jgi:hypothetical protein